MSAAAAEALISSSWTICSTSRCPTVEPLLQPVDHRCFHGHFQVHWSLMMLPWQHEWKENGNPYSEALARYQAEPQLAYAREWEMKRFYNFKGDICPDRLRKVSRSWSGTCSRRSKAGLRLPNFQCFDAAGVTVVESWGVLETYARSLIKGEL